MEGVTQYIPKESTADTLQKIKTLVASGSTLLITYVDQNVFDDPSRVADNTKACSMILKQSARVGEPWITGWTQEGFADFLKECGYQVVSDTTCKDYNDKYLAPLGRKLDEKDIINLERLVVAKLL
ncbi:Exhibits S-adenosyl-L-methionine-dependent methyltransferase activity (By similarity) [Seminavis robusta]|uniref:Exhibits S-adenosyl-L-methionine-dependent methyltransferase activity By similarity n=1 Tax=Seminavis robusta TaxID=568900 RepID=A0A9N8DE86_9STRA|nr:Exhibits S-adenosyl-L-methionine-dependent methyltransferase activity (By similarity) [Seminavis robusta]|eukprot:Sro82_g043860.1 Exhibits S-adenosyl-L-methionine-dependent methyltransferase activity (By similarity) (126) ;mRNA; r:60033-60410